MSLILINYELVAQIVRRLLLVASPARQAKALVFGDLRVRLLQVVALSHLAKNLKTSNFLNLNTVQVFEVHTDIQT